MEGLDIRMMKLLKYVLSCVGTSVTAGGTVCSCNESDHLLNAALFASSKTDSNPNQNPIMHTK